MMNNCVIEQSVRLTLLRNSGHSNKSLLYKLQKEKNDQVLFSFNEGEDTAIATAKVTSPDIHKCVYDIKLFGKMRKE